MSVRRVRPSGGAMLMRAGKRPMLLGLLPDERKKIERAARLTGQKMTEFVTAAALTAAEIVIKKGNSAA